MKHRRNRQNNMTPEEKREIVELYVKGVKTVVISEAYRRAPNTIYTLLRDRGIPKRREIRS